MSAATELCSVEVVVKGSIVSCVARLLELLDTDMPVWCGLSPGLQRVAGCR